MGKKKQAESIIHEAITIKALSLSCTLLNIQSKYLRNRKHFLCFYEVIKETQMDI